MDPQITDDPTHNERAAIAWLAQENDRLMAEVADRETVINFLLMKMHGERNNRLNRAAELASLKKKLKVEVQQGGSLPSRSAEHERLKLLYKIRRNLERD